MFVYKFNKTLILICINLSFASMSCQLNSSVDILASNGHIEIVAHRGESYLAPENTLAAMNMAWDNGANAVEVDVHLTKDGRIVAIHDYSTARTGNKSLYVSRTDSSILRKLDMGCHKGPEFAGEKIPFLKEILTNLPLGQRLFIDVKCGIEIIPELKYVLSSEDKNSQIVIIGFDLNTLSKIKSLIPDVSVYWLLKPSRIFPYKKDLIAKALKKGMDGIDAHHIGVTSGFIRDTKAVGLDLCVWTVDDTHDAENLIALGVDGITTNRAGFLLNQLNTEIKIARIQPESTLPKISQIVINK